MILLEHIRSHRLSAQAQGATAPAPPPPDFTCQSQAVGPSANHNFCLIWLQIRGSHVAPQAWLICSSSSQNQGNIYQLIKGYCRDPDEEQDE